MGVDSLASQYRLKTDDELLQLASESRQLTPEAQLVLKGELWKRRIEPTTESPQAGNEPEGRVGANPGPVSGRLGEFVPGILRLYRRHRWLFLELTAPAVVIGTVALILSRHEQRQIIRRFPVGDWLIRHHSAFFEATLIGLTANLTTWFAFCFSFAGICAAVEQIESGYGGSFLDSFHAVRARVSPLLGLSLLLVLIFAAIEILVSLLTTSIFWTADRFHIHLASLIQELVIFLCAGLGLLVLSRFALAIPALVLDDFGAVHSIFRSDDLTRRKSPQLAVLVAKSLIGGYVAAMLPFWLARWIPADIDLPMWFPWFLTAASVAAVTVVEPVAFIGFALLYLRETAVDSDAKLVSTAAP